MIKTQYQYLAGAEPARCEYQTQQQQRTCDHTP
jgi:hypothetical protein